MDNEIDWALWRSYRAAWERAELLQWLLEGDSVLFGVIFDSRQRRWLVNCVDTNQWITKRFRGGHRSYYAEVWRQE